MNKIIFTNFRTRIQRVIDGSKVSYVVESCDLAGEWHPTKTTVYLSTAKHYARLQASGLYQEDYEARYHCESLQAKHLREQAEYQREHPNG